MYVKVNSFRIAEGGNSVVDEVKSPFVTQFIM